MRLKSFKIIFLLGLLLLPIFTLKAAETSARQAVFIAENEIITGNLFAAGDTVTIDGVISGDLITAANSINVSGRIEGDIIAISQNIDITGEIGGNVRVLANIAHINGLVARNVSAIGSNITIGENARIGWDVIIAAANTQIKGVIDGSLNNYFRQTLISGKIGKSASLYSYHNQPQNIIIAKEAIINGDLNYTSNNEAEIKQGAQISGQVNHATPTIEKKNNVSSWAWGRIFSILSIFLIGLSFIFFIPNFTRRLTLTMKTKVGISLLIGALVFLVVPPLAILLTITIIGIPLATILLSLWLAGLFLAKTLSAILVGELILKDLFKLSTNIFWTLLVGSIIISLLFAIPYLGWIIRLVLISLGLGSLIFYATNQSKNI